MALAYNEEQRSLKKTARDIAQHKSPVEAFRKVREAQHSGKDLNGFDAALWNEMVELGWAGMPFPEAYGGFEFGYMGLAGCMEELGRTLVASPLLSNVLLAGSTILFAGSEEQKQTLVAQIASGEIRFALALEEGNHHAPSQIATTAKASGDNFVLNGKKTLVVDGYGADKLVVAARTAGNSNDTAGITLFLVDAKASGVAMERLQLLDSRNYALVTFNNVSVHKADVLGKAGEGFAALDQALDRARICLASEMIGGMQEIFERTVQYLKERKQFGKPIAEFQAVQSTLADMATEIEAARLLVYNAARLKDAKASYICEAAMAKYFASEVAEKVASQAVEVYGGYGFVKDYPVEKFYRDAKIGKIYEGTSNMQLATIGKLLLADK